MRRDSLDFDYLGAICGRPGAALSFDVPTWLSSLEEVPLEAYNNVGTCDTTQQVFNYHIIAIFA